MVCAVIGVCLSLSVKGTGAWLEAIPSSVVYSMISELLSPSVSSEAGCMYGNAFSFSQVVGKCECGLDPDEDGYHLLTCKFGGGLELEHNCVKSGWSHR